MLVRERAAEEAPACAVLQSRVHDAGRVLKGAVPSPSLSLPFSPQTVLCAVQALVRKKEEGLRVTDRIKGSKGGPPGAQCSGILWSKTENAVGDLMCLQLYIRSCACSSAAAVLSAQQGQGVSSEAYFALCKSCS